MLRDSDALIRCLQTQNNVYEIVSDMNQKQEILEERIVALEDRLNSIHEHLEALPDVLGKVVQIALSSQRLLLDPSHGSAAEQPPGSRHTHLHPSDATRPSWSANSLAGGSPPGNTKNTFLVPATPQPGSLDA